VRACDLERFEIDRILRSAGGALHRDEAGRTAGVADEEIGAHRRPLITFRS
jgi:hypothetical protein